MTTVYSVTELKQAIEKGETMVKAGNKQMEKVLNLLCDAFPVAGGVVAGGALAAVIAKIAAGGAITIAGATATISAISLTTGTGMGACYCRCVSSIDSCNKSSWHQD